MGDLEAITRNEKLWSGEDLTPATRKEMYIKHLYDETQVIPEYPVTREEMFILKAGEELHDVTIEQLTATENRTYSEEGVAYSPVIVNVPQTTLSTLEVSENGDYDAPSGTAYNRVDVNVPLPSNAYLLKDIPNLPSPIATFTDGANLPMPKLEIGIEPVQDLHGYDAPWVGGAGKNKLPLILDNIKVNNTSGTWNGNTYVHPNGITFNIITNNSGAIEKIVATGTASGNVVLLLDSATFKPWTGTFIINGCIEGSGSTYFWDMQAETSGNIINYDGDTSFVPNQNYRPRIVITSGYQCPTNGITFKPMIRLASETDATFEPYSNICPISGFTEGNVTVADATTDPTVENIYTIDLDGTRYGGTLDVVSGVLTVDRAKIVFDGSSDENWQKSSSGNMYYLTLNATTFPYVKDHNNYNIANCYKFKGFATSGYFSFLNDAEYLLFDYGTGTIREIAIKNLSISTVEDFKASLASNPLELIYELATPLTIQLTPTSIKSLQGINNVFADTGDVVDGSYFSKGV